MGSECLNACRQDAAFRRGATSQRRGFVFGLFDRLVPSSLELLGSAAGSVGCMFSQQRFFSASCGVVEKVVALLV